MNRNKFWFGVPRNAEGAEGGGADAGASGTGATQAAGGEAAGAVAPAPAATFLTAAGQAKPEGETAKPAEGGDAKPESEAAKEGDAAAPPTIDLATLTLADGFELDPEVGAAFTNLLLDDKLAPQERAQKLMDIHMEAVKAASEGGTKAVQEANMALWTKTNDEWRAAIKELPEFKENPDAEAGKVLQALTAVGAGEDFFKALDMTGAGNHPAILQVLHRLAKPFMEGGAVQGVNGAKAARQLGANIYTSTKT